MAFFRKKPVVIEARKLTIESHQGIANWIATSGYEVRHATRPPVRDDAGSVIKKAAVTGLVIKTLEGDMTADYGDYVIMGVKGEFYPCKPDIFEATYESADGAPGE
ncbi:hypothetical protein [Agrobacterium tumefaciens]|uniref:hypothetical protein n=1 Tax=Agrobacterium tumefaciens TaxID=358 RepID=UPI0021D29DC2|nr:hypothetical protein [Agrobacterium tumefaciens]UXS23095.1 hypothetical protein FY153_01005 [Agrobacterium tumefaciens]